MTKRRSTWLGASGALFLVLSLSGVAAGATPPDAVPDVVVDTTATFEDIDGNGIDDDCQDVDAVADEDAAAAELLTVDTNARRRHLDDGGRPQPPRSAARTATTAAT